MRRLYSSMLAAVLLGAVFCPALVAQSPYRVRALAPDPVVIWKSDDPRHVYPRSPGLCRLEDGRLVFTMEYNLGASNHLPDMKQTEDGKWVRGQVHVSDDGGETFRQTGAYPMYQARPFTAGEGLYILGCYGDLGITVSKDRGETWSEVSWLTEDQQWHQAPSNVRHAHGKIYLVMERIIPPNLPVWPVQSKAPVVMAAPVDADLTQRGAWTFSNEMPFKALIKEVGVPNAIGVPFYFPGPAVRGKKPRNSRPMAPPGWLETHIVTFPDPNNLWHDPEDRTMYLWARSHTGTTNMAAIAKAVEDETGAITVQPARAPSGKAMVYVPCPGGHLKFYILYDEPSGLFWMASNQSTDSMTHPAKLPASRYMLADNERDRLVLHFSRNCIDWCFAGLIDKTGKDRQPRSYPSMVVDGKDLVVVARSGDAESKNAHDGNIVTLHRIKKFRRLVY